MYKVTKMQFPGVQREQKCSSLVCKGNKNAVPWCTKGTKMQFPWCTKAPKMPFPCRTHTVTKGHHCTGSLTPG